MFLYIFFTAVSMPWYCPPGEPDNLTSKLAYSTEKFLGLLYVSVVMHKQQLWATAESALMLDVVIVLKQPWEHLGPIMSAHKAGGNACGVLFSCRYSTGGNWESTKAKKRLFAFNPFMVCFFELLY